MNAFALSGILIAVTSFGFAIFVYWQGRHTKANKLWSVFCLLTAIWGAGVYKIASTSDMAQAEWWWRITHIGVIFVPIIFWHYVYEFLNIKKKLVLAVIYFIGFFFLLANFFTDLFINNVRWVFNSFYYNLPSGILYPLFVVFFFAAIIYAHYELYKALKKSYGLRRRQIEYFFLATIVGFAGSSVSFLPAFGIDFYPIFNFTVPLYPIIMTYAIFRYRLMDIRVAVRKSFIYLALTSFIYLIFYLTSFFFIAAWGSIFATKSLLAGIFIATIFVAVFPRFQKQVQSFINRYLYAGVYNTEKTMVELSEKLSALVETEEIIDTIIKTIINTIGCNQAGVIINNPHSKVCNISDKNNLNNISCEPADATASQLPSLIRWSEQTKQIVVAEELERVIEQTIDSQAKLVLENIYEEMKKNDISLSLPLMWAGEQVGLITLGYKVNRGPYSAEDINLLEVVANNAAIALKNAQLYNEMEKLVNAQTKELREKNQDLKEMLEARSNFLSIASHQLRTPVAIARGMLSMLIEDELPQTKKKHFLKRSYETIGRLNDILQDLLSSRAVEGKELKLNKEKADINELVAKIVDERIIKANEKGLKLIYKQPKKSALIKIDVNKITEVFANLIDNAIQYTPKGKVEIFTEATCNNFIFKIKDSGIGIKGQDVDKLFKKISRLPNAIKVRPSGTGLGLYIVKCIVEAHGGTVEVDSCGLNMGSTFTVKLPVGVS